MPLDLNQLSREAGDQRLVEAAGDRQDQGAAGQEFAGAGQAAETSLQGQVQAFAFEDAAAFAFRVVEQGLVVDRFAVEREDVLETDSVDHQFQGELAGFRGA
ncbi:hypothetical protein [Actinoplanes derwentensis]|uniref:hypothetical protein n=1 Tax=Actinoplanes derwentensis TaxID=113562 RepID=UPI001E45601D|nr:hypothetical protein [Actinoplanes derwentensis]